MAEIEQVLNYVKNITETLNQWAANAKKTEELPAMETMDPDGLLMVSHLDNGVWKSKKLEIQKIIDGISLSGQNNNVREVLLGTITATQNLNYLLDNNGITVTEDEIIVLTALTTINATLVQKQYLWKLGKGEYNPIGSANIATKMLELQPRLLNEIISDELTSSPSAVVYDLGVISNTVLENINNANPAYNFTDDEKIYYIRYIKNDVKILYNFIGINNNYGLDQSQMTQADLVLVYSSANSDPTELLNTKLDKGGYSGSAMTLHQEVTSLDQDLNTKIDDFKNQLEQVELPLKADKSETYTKSEIDNKISSVYKYKGSVANYSSLPITNQVIGDVWNVIDTDKNYAWSGTVWDDLGGIGDISGKEDKTQKGAPSGYAPLDEFTKLAAQYLNIVNDLVTGGATALLSAEQGKVLQTQVSAINTLLTSDNVNLDNIQELVDAIETVQLSLSTILVNDLTSGGTTKALTAEMGKQLDLIKESTANKSTSIFVDYLSNIKFPNVKAVYDFCMSAFKKKFLSFGDVTGIAHTFGEGSENTMYKFSNNNPITATIPTNATTPFEIGTVFETIAIGNGALTATGAPGVTILTNLSNTSVKNEVRRYTKIDTDTWTVEGNKLDKGLTFGTIFLSSSGNDATAEYQNSLRPYLTLDAALTAYQNNSTAIRIEIISGSSFSTTSQMAFAKILNIFSNYPCTITVNSSISNIFSGCPSVNIDIKNGTIVFSPTTDNTGNFASVPITIFANIITFNSTWFGEGNQNGGTISLNSSVLNVNTARAILACTGGNRTLIIKSRTINMRNAGACLARYFVYLELDFDNLTHDNSFMLHGAINSSRAIINHGNISSVSPYTNATNVTYIFASELYITYKNSASITSNLTISRFNTNGVCYIVGVCSIPNSIGFIRGNNVFSSNAIVFNKAYIEAQNLIVAQNQMIGRVFFIDSNIRLSGNTFISYYEAYAGATYTLPTAIFRGYNTVIVGTDGALITEKESGFVSANEPQWDLRDGVLFTNGLVNDNVTFLRRTLNQYNSTTIIP